MADTEQPQSKELLKMFSRLSRLWRCRVRAGVCFWSACLALGIGLAAPSALLAQGSQSGSLTGKVTAGGVGLPGVTVTIESPALQGKRTQTT